MPVNPKGGTIFGYESVTATGDMDPPVDLAVIVIRPDAIEAAGLLARFPDFTRWRVATTCPARVFTIVTVADIAVSGPNRRLSRVLHFCNFLLDLWIVRGQYRPQQGDGVGH